MTEVDVEQHLREHQAEQERVADELPDDEMGDERQCAHCGDVVGVLSSRDWCDGCEEEAAAAVALAEQEAADATGLQVVWPANGVMPDGSPAPQCTHPPEFRVRDEDGTQVCTQCSEVVDASAVAVRDGGPTAVEPFDVGQGRMEHMPWPPGPATRPYTPEDVEHEILAMVARLNSGARYEARVTRELAQATTAYALAYDDALIDVEGRSKEIREAKARRACREQFERLAELQADYKTTRAGMHTLRSQLNAMQTVNASVRTQVGAR